MRSRYSAFCLGEVDYLIATRHPSGRRLDDRRQLLATLAKTEWVNLRVLATELGTAEDETGEVEFVATYKEDGILRQLHERSHFVREGDRWFYASGEHENLRALPKPGRNEPCWCGSGKKYKKCHG
jgi:SEC-C motif-containing protein